MCKLFIIGNGFDMASGLKTSYKDFRNYMYSIYEPRDELRDRMPKSESPGIIKKHDEKDMGKFLCHLVDNTCKKNNWSDFEEALGNLNFDYALVNWESFQIIDYVENNGHVPPVPVWNEKRNLEEFEVNLDAIIGFLNDCFTGWIETININQGHKINKFSNSIDLKTSKFLNFNYTMTLENLYNIPSENICHIHIYNEKFIFGHGIARDKTIEYYNIYGNECIAKTFQQITAYLRKNTWIYLNQNDNFFLNLNSITEIYSYGFSFANVDLQYIRRICEVVNTNNVTWYQYSYNGSDYTNILRDCGFLGTIRFW